MWLLRWFSSSEGSNKHYACGTLVPGMACSVVEKRGEQMNGRKTRQNLAHSFYRSQFAFA